MSQNKLIVAVLLGATTLSPVFANAGNGGAAPTFTAPANGSAYNGGYYTPNTGPAGLPEAARPGQCFARVLVPAQYRDVPMQVVTQDGAEQVSVTQAQFRDSTANVVTRDGYRHYEVTEPQFRTERQSIVVRPAYERLEVSQPTYEARAETVTIREPRLVWRRGDGLSDVRRLDPNTGEIYCLVEEQGQTRTITRRVQTNPGAVRRVGIPAQTRVVERQVLVRDGSVHEVAVPAVVTSVAVSELVAPAQEHRVAVAPQYGTISRQEMVSAERYDWVEVVCDQAGAGRATVTDIQRALASRGLYRGPIDGIVGPQTRAAARSFQRANHLPGDGALTTELVRALGL